MTIISTLSNLEKDIIDYANEAKKSVEQVREEIKLFIQSKRVEIANVNVYKPTAHKE